MGDKRFFTSGFRVTQKFGNKHPYFSGKYHRDFYAKFNSPKGHNGIDIVPIYKNDTDIFAPFAGKIVHLEDSYKNSAGAYVKMETFDGLILYFFHLLEWSDNLKKGTVEKNQFIGIMGGSGNGKKNCYAPHLHFQVKRPDSLANNGYSGCIDPHEILEWLPEGIPENHPDNDYESLIKN